MRIKTKLFLAFLSIGLLSICLGVISYNNDVQIKNEVLFLIKHDLMVLENAHELEKLVVDTETGQMGFIMSGDEDFLESYHTNIKNFDELIKIEKQLVSDTPPQVEKLETIERLFNIWILKMDLIKNERFQDLSHTATDHLQIMVDYVVLDEIRSEFQEFIIIENNQIEERYLKSLELESRTEILTVIIPGIIVSSALIMGFLLYRSISVPISKLKRGTNNLAIGEELILDVSGDDEISQLTQSFNTMANSIQLSKRNKEKNFQIMQKQKNKLIEMKDALDEAAIVSTTDVNGTIVYVNDSFCNISKFSREELVGENDIILKSGYHTDKFYKNILETISSGKIWRGNIKNKAKDGTFYWGKTTIMPIFDSHNKISQYVSVRIDITHEQDLYNELNETHMELAKNNEIIKQQSKEHIQKLILENKLSESHAELKSEKKFNSQKEEFAAMVSHELKTPIFPIKMHCEMLKDSEMMGKLNPEQRESVDMIEKMALNLEHLTGDIFDAQKLDMNQMQFNKKKFKLCKFLDEIKLDVKQLVNEKKISMNFDFDDIQITTDRDRLSQVLSNLIRNSIDFVEENSGKIDIGAMQKEDKIVFYVKDNGIGIPADKIPKMFRKFYQIDTTLKRRHGGTGLGLVICKGIVEGLGGNIWVYSEIGKGTTFTFDIPYQTIHEIQNDITNV